MTALIRYAAAALVLVGVGVGLLWMFLDEAGRRGVLVAAFVSYPVQLMAFWLLVRVREDASRFFVWWGAGIGLRVVLVVAVGFASYGLDPEERAPLLLSMVGFLFALLLIEPFFLRIGRKDARTTA